MANYSIRNGDELIDENGRLVGVRNPDSSESMFVFSEVDGVTGRIDISSGGKIAASFKMPTNLAVFGDSHAANHSGGLGTDIRGGAVWALNFSDHPYYFDHSLNFGVGGETSTQILSRIASVIAAKPDRVYVSAGTNDETNGISWATTRDNLASIFDQLNDAGIAVDFRSLTQRATATWGGTSGKLATYRRNDAARNLCAKGRNRSYIDINSALSDPADAASQLLANYSSDGTHVTGAGAFAEGAVYAQFLRQVASRRNKSCPYASIYNASNSPGGNLLFSGAESLGALNGSNALSGTGYAGNWANVVAPSRMAGAGTITGSKEATQLSFGGIAIGNSYNRQVVAFSGCNGADKFKLFWNVATGSTVVAGDQLVAEIEVELVSVVGLTSIFLLCQEGWGSYAYQAGSFDTSDASSFPFGSGSAVSTTFTLRTPIRTAATNGSGGLGIDLRMCGLNGTSPLSGTIKLGRPRIFNLTQGGYF